MCRSIRLVPTRRALHRALQLSAIVALGSCSENCDDPTGPDFQAVVVGEVTLNDEPVPDVVVTAGENRSTTDAQGRYNVTVQSEADPFHACLGIETEPFATVFHGAWTSDRCPVLEAGSSASYDFRFEQDGPTVEIISPEDGASLEAGAMLFLNDVSASVRINGLVGASGWLAEVRWSSSLDGDLGVGVGGVLGGVALSPGRHVLTAAVTDALGSTATDQVTVTVGSSENQAPVAAITAPANGVSIPPSGNPVTFEGTGDDAEDGTLSGSALVWTSSQEGQIGTGATFTRTMAEGSHVIVLTVTDAHGVGDADTVSIHIESARAGTGIITGRVTLDGDPLPGFSLTLSGTASAGTATDSDGYYTFADLAAGPYTVSIEPPTGSGIPASQSVTLAAGETLTMNFGN